MNAPAAPEESVLMFEWAHPTGEKFLISTFLIGSLVLHALAFYLFRIIYPPAISVLPPPARVNLIAANSEDGRTLLRWIESEDPALASATVRPAETRARTLPKLGHIPSYMVEEPKLKDAPPIELVPDTPSAFPPGPAPITRPSPEPSWPKLPTRVSLSDELKAFGQTTLPAPQFAGSTGEPPENVQFRIAVNKQGEIRYCFPMNSSGDSSLDEQARQWLIRSRFADSGAAGEAAGLLSNGPGKQTGAPTELPVEQTSPTDLIWGVATVQWGNDVTQPTRNSAPSSQ